MELSGQHNAPAALALWKNAGTHIIGSWVGILVGLDIIREKKNLDPGGIFTRFCKIAKVTYFVVPVHASVCPHGTTRLPED
jgi:hypothetical protein